MIHSPNFLRSAARRLLSQPHRAADDRQQITTTITTSCVKLSPAQSIIASISGSHRIIKMTIWGNQINFFPGIWDILISDNPATDAQARRDDRRISGLNTGRPGYFANPTPTDYKIDILSLRPKTFYKLIDHNVPPGNYIAFATLTAIRL